MHKCANRLESQVSILEENLFKMINAEIERVAFDPLFAEFIKNILSDAISGSKKDSGREKQVIRRKISAMEVKKDKLYDLFLEDDHFNRDDLRRKLENFDKEIEGLTNHAKALGVNAEKLKIEVDNVISTLQALPGRYSLANNERKALILRELMQYIEVHGDEVRFVLNRPYDIFMRQEVNNIKRDVLR